MSETRSAAIGRLYEETGFLVLRRCLRITGNAEEAMDATQWTYMRALETGFEVRSRGEALSWLYRTAVRRCLTLVRSQSTRSRLLDRHSAEIAGMPRPPVDVDVISRDLLARAIADLSDETAELAIATYIQGLSNEQTAEMYGVSTSTVGRARAAFEAALRALSLEAS